MWWPRLIVLNLWILRASALALSHWLPLLLPLTWSVSFASIGLIASRCQVSAGGHWRAILSQDQSFDEPCSPAGFWAGGGGGGGLMHQNDFLWRESAFCLSGNLTGSNSGQGLPDLHMMSHQSLACLLLSTFQSKWLYTRKQIHNYGWGIKQ